MEALDGLVGSIPEWHNLLDDLNGKIASRQYELAQLGDYRPPTRSLKNKGSTESLRHKDLTESPLKDGENAFDSLQINSEPPPTLARTSGSPTPFTPIKSLGRTTTTDTRPAYLVPHNSSPGPQRRTSNRNGSNVFASKPNSPQHAVHKRKTTSVASNDSQAPKYRTRSMIIVYYDSAVQNAFEDLVKFISASRNNMRKGKMAQRMADMRRMAELEVESDEEEDEEESKDGKLSSSNNGPFGYIHGNGHAIAVRKDDGAADGESDTDLKLKFISTRRMGPSRDMVAMQRNTGATRANGSPLPGLGMSRHTNWRSGGLSSGSSSGSASIFDELDSGLEWCQSMCEHAAHQFLRDGDCTIEIDGIKRRLNEVKEAVDRQQTINAAEEAERAKTNADRQLQPDKKTSEKPRGEKHQGSTLDYSVTRSLKPIHMRRSPSVGPGIESNVPIAMEVDEGYEDESEEELPKLQFRSTREI
jgi:hypothetical protein